MSAMPFDALTAVLLIPVTAAALLAVIPGYRLGARLNVLASLLTLLAALLLRLTGLAFGEPQGGTAPAEASHVPMYVHLGLVLVAGLYLPPPLVAWFRNVAGLLG